MQNILVTGANRGIGLALAAELLADGHRVFATARQPAQAAHLQDLKDTHDALQIIALDVTDDASVKQAASEIAVAAGSLDLLINNAAVFPEDGDESIFEMNLDHFRQAFETNVLGVIRVSRQFFPLLEKGANPRIVNISSGAASVAAKVDYGYYAYATSKTALNMVTRAMAAEFRPKSICVVAMTPGWVKTEMGGDNAPLTPQQSARAIARTVTALTMKQTSHFLERNGDEVGYGW